MSEAYYVYFVVIPILSLACCGYFFWLLGCSTSAFTYITCDIDAFNVSINTACIRFFKLCNQGYIITYIHSNIQYYFAASIEHSLCCLAIFQASKIIPTTDQYRDFDVNIY